MTRDELEKILEKYQLSARTKESQELALAETIGILAEFDRLKKQNAEAIAFLRKTAQLNQKYANLILADQEFFIAVEGALRKSKAATEDVLQALKENENDKG